MEEYTKVTFRVKKQEYINYKKNAIDNHTTPTADLNAHIIQYNKDNNKKQINKKAL